MAAADEADLMHMIATAAAIDDRPSAVRYPRGEGMGVDMPARGQVLPIGKGRILKEGTSIAILNLGTRLKEALKAAEELAARGLSTTIADARFAKPLDNDLIRRLAHEHPVLITLEEGAAGGFAAHVMQFMALDGLLDNGLKFRPMTLPDIYHRPGQAGGAVRSGRPERQAHRRHRADRARPQQGSGGSGARLTPARPREVRAAAQLPARLSSLVERGLAREPGAAPRR